MYNSNNKDQTMESSVLRNLRRLFTQVNLDVYAHKKLWKKISNFIVIIAVISPKDI
jgi:hypothetical protein